MDLQLQVKLAVYRETALRGSPPRPEAVAGQAGISLAELKTVYAEIAARRLLVLESDGLGIRMAPAFSGVPTQHRVHVAGVDYFANCAWDALGIPAALHRPGEVRSRSEQSPGPLHLRVGLDGPEASLWLFHCLVPAARWWKDIVHT